MSEAVDTRIVEAKFDSAQFEKGVNKTVKKLDDLKKSLNLDEAGKSIAQLADKTQQATDKASNALQQLEDRFTNFAGMLKQKLLSGIADEIVGVFFKIKSGFEGLVKSLSSSQMTAGMGKYEQMLTSVRTMIAAGDSENAAYAAIETLGEYADQTSYSLDQMTSALSKMRAAGVDLETGTKAVEGISNACAAAGVNATDASRAFYNLAQAYSSGYLKYTDYRSLELLNMTTEKFKLQMLDAASAAGTLKKISDGVYQTVNKNDKKVAAGKKVTAKNLSEALKYNFMNTEAMNKLFGEGFFFDEKEWKKIKSEFAAANKSEEEALAEAKVRFGDVAVNAYFAAREARSFTDVMNTLKDVISRGWSKSFEWIFGTLEEATKFFTDLAESNLANAIYNISAFRNAILENWADSGGRKNMIEALQNIDELLGRILGHFTIFTDSESPEFENATVNIGHRLSQASRDFKKFTERLDAWFTEKRIARIRKVISTIGTVISTVFRALGVAFDFITKVFETIEPVIGKIIDNVDKVVNKINSIFNAGKGNNKTKDGLDSLEIGLDNVVKAIDPLIEPLGNVIDFLGDVASFLVDIATGSFIANLDFLADTLGFIIELFGGKSAQQERGVGILDGLKNSVKELSDACKDALKFVGDFFSNLYEDILTMLGIHELPEGEEGGFFKNVINFFNTSEFIANIKKWFDELPGKIDKIIYGTKKIKKEKINGRTVGFETYYEGGLINVFKNAFEKVKSWITTEFPEEIKKIWSKIDEFFFGKKTGTITRKREDGQTETVTMRMKTGFSQLLDDIFTSVKTFVTVDVPKKAKEIWDSIIDSIFGKTSLSSSSTENAQAQTKEVVKSGFVTWFEKTIEDVKEWITTIPEKISEIWNSIIDFIFYRDPEVNEVNPDTGEKYGPNDRVKNGLLQWIEAIPENIVNWIKDLPQKISNIWNKVLDFIFGEYAKPGQVKNPDTGETYGPNERVKEGFSAWLNNTVKTVSDWVGTVPDKIKAIWDTVLGALFGDGLNNTDDKYNFDQTVYNQLMSEDSSGYGAHEYEQWCKQHSNPILKSVEETVKALGLDIGKIMSNIPAHIIDGWNFTLDLTGSFFEHLTEFLKGKSEEKIKNKAGEEVSALLEENAEDIADQVKDSAEASPLLTAIITFGQNIGKMVTTTIPGVLSAAWDLIKSKGADGISTAVKSIFGLPDSWWTDFNKDAEDFGLKVAAKIEQIPDNIRSAVETVKNFFSGETELENIRKDIRKQFTIKDEDGNIQIIDEKGLKVALNAAEAQFRRARSSSGLWNAIKEILGASKDAIVELGPDILNGLNEVFKWVGDRLSDVTEIFNEKITNGGDFSDAAARVMEEKGEKNSAFAEALTNIGQTLFNLITTIIPNFIKSGIEVLVQEVPKLFNKIKELFGGENDLQSQAENAGRGLLESFGEDLTESTDVVDSYTRSLFGGNESSKKKDLIDTLNLKKEELEFMIKYADKSSDDYKQLNEQYTRINEAIKKTNELTDEEVKLSDVGLTNKDLELRTRVKRTERLAELEQIYKNKQDKYYETIRKLQESAFDQSSYKDNPKYLRAEADYQEAKQALDAVKKTNDEWVYLDDDALKNMDSGLAGVSNILDTLLNFGTSKTTQAIGIIAAIAWLLHELKQTLTFTDEVESFGWTAKWTGISIAMAGITAIMGYITYLAAQDDQTKIQHVMDVFDKFTAFIQKLAEMLQTIALMKLGTSGLDAFSSFFGWKTAKSAEKTASAAGELVKSGSWIGNFITNISSTLLKYGLVTTGSDVIGGALESLFDSLGDTFAGIIESVDTVMSFIGPAIKKASELKTDLDDAIDVVEGLAELIGKFYHVIDLQAIVVEGRDSNGNLVKKDTSMIDDAPDWVSGFEMMDSRLEEEIERRIAVVSKISSLMNNLSSSLEKMQEVENVREQMNKILSVFGVQDEKGSSLFGQVIQKIVTVICESLIPMQDTMTWYNSSPIDFDSAAACFQIIGNAMSVFSDGLTGLTIENVNALSESINVIERLLEAFDEENAGKQSLLSKVFGGDRSLSTFGKEIKLFGTRLVDFFGYIKKLPGVKDDEYQETQRAIDFVIQVAKGLSEATGILSTAATNYTDVDTLVEELGHKLQGFGSNVGAFITAVNGSLGEGISLERVQMIATGTSAFLDVARSISELSEYMFNSDKIPVIFSALMQAISENLGTNDNAFYNLGLDAGSNLDAGLAEGISTGKAIDAAQTLADTIKGIFPFVWKEHSPSELTELYGRFLDEGLKNGIDLYSKGPTDSMRQLAEDIIEEANSVLGDPKALKENKEEAQIILDDVLDIMNSFPEEVVNKAEKFNAPSLLEFIGNTVIGFANSKLERLFGNGVNGIQAQTENAANAAGNAIKAFANGIQSDWDIDWAHAFDETEDIPSMNLDLMLTPERAAKIAGKIRDTMHGVISTVVTEERASIGDLNILGAILEASAENMPDSAVTLFIKDTFDQVRAAIENGTDLETISEGVRAVLSEGFNNITADSSKAEELAGNISEVINAATELSQDDATIKPEITPVLVITDSFRTAMNDVNTFMSNFSAFNELMSIGENGSLTVNTTATGLAEQFEALKGTDYSGLIQEINSGIGSLQKDIQGVSSSLGSMKFIINGKEFAYTIGPDINEYLGYEDATRGGRYDAWTQMES